MTWRTIFGFYKEKEEKPSSPAPFKIGQGVRHLTGGPKMVATTAKSYETHYWIIGVTWWDCDRTFHREEFFSFELVQFIKAGDFA